MKSFDQVTHATQRKWLRQLGEAALARYGIEDAQLRFISDSSSTVFRVDTVSQRYVLRINSEPPDRWMTWTEAELLWLLALKRDTDLPVPEPVVASNGALVHKVSTNNIPEGCVVTLLRWIPGQSIGKRPEPDLARQIGAFMAQLHNHTEQFSLPDAINRPRTVWDKLRYWQDPQNDTSDTLTPEERDLCAIASERLLAEIEGMGITENYGLIHADLTLNNCLLHQKHLRVIDFADCRYGSHYYDIAALLTNFTEYWHIEPRDYDVLKEEFYQGYSQIRSLGQQYDSAVETFIIARAFDIVEWIHLDWPDMTYFPFDPAILSQAIQRIRDYMS